MVLIKALSFIAAVNGKRRGGSEKQGKAYIRVVLY